MEVVKDLIPPAKKGGGKRRADIRQILNACFYLTKRAVNGECCRMNIHRGEQFIGTLPCGRKTARLRRFMTNLSRL